MYANTMPTTSVVQNLQNEPSISNWSVTVYRKNEHTSLSYSNDSLRSQPTLQAHGSFYIQLNQQHSTTASSHSNVLHLRYCSQPSSNNSNNCSLPFTISLLNDVKLSDSTSPSMTSSSSASRFYSVEQQTVRTIETSTNLPTVLLRAKAFLGILVINISAGARPFMIFVTDEICLGRLFDVHIYRITQVATISLRDCVEDETHAAGIKRLFQGRCFYYSKCVSPETSSKPVFNRPYDITLCTQRMAHGHDSDLRFFWNRGLCLPLLKYNIDIRSWIPKIICGGVEKYSNQGEIDLWVISRLSCERAGTRFNVRGINDDGAVANFVETEQIVVCPQQNSYSSFLIVRGSIPLFWEQTGFQVSTPKIFISRNEDLCYQAFFKHFKRLYRHYGSVSILNLIGLRDHEKDIGEKYRTLFKLLLNTTKQAQANQGSLVRSLSERNFIWFDYHDQMKTVRNITPDQFVQEMLLENKKYPIDQELQQHDMFIFTDGKISNLQKGVFRINCIDCLDRTNNVQLAIGLKVFQSQLKSLKTQFKPSWFDDKLRELWINNGNHISRIYTGTGALGQGSKTKDIQRSVSRAIQNNLRDDEKQQAIQTLIYTYAKDSYLHERSVVSLGNPYVIADSVILNELFKVRHNYVRTEKIRVSVGTWNINGDKNHLSKNEYALILDAWMLHGPDNRAEKRKKPDAIQTIGFATADYESIMPEILVIGFQEICDLTASNLVSASKSNAKRWVENVKNHFQRAYPNHRYTLLGFDQLVGVCLAIFIRYELVPFVKHIGIDTVKTGMGGALGNKGCVAIRLVLHSTSLCFICGHFTAGQNETSERNKDYKSIMDRLAFSPPSRALWHDHVFFLGDFNYRLTTPRTDVIGLAQNKSYKKLMEYDQLLQEQLQRRIFHDFKEGPIEFAPTYKYDINSDIYDTSEKARVPSYTDRILWNSTKSGVEVKQLYYGRAEVKTSDHRPVNAIFEVDIEICDEKRLREEHEQIHRRFTPSNGLIVFQMRPDVRQEKQKLIEEFESYVKRKCGSDMPIIDRFFIANDRFLSLYMFFQNGEYARRVMELKEDALPSETCFNKSLIELNDDIALMLKLKLLFADPTQSINPNSNAYDLGDYQQPPNTSSSRSPDDIENTSIDNDCMYSTILANGEYLQTQSLDSAASYQNQSEDDEVMDFHLMDETLHQFESYKRMHRNISLRNTFDGDDDDDDDDDSTSNDTSSTECDSNLVYHSDGDQSSGRKARGPGPLKSYLKERVEHWSKTRYHKYKFHRMKKHGIPLNYGNIHTKDIKISRAHEKRQRKKEAKMCLNIASAHKDVPSHAILPLYGLSADPKLTSAITDRPDDDLLTVSASAQEESQDNHSFSLISFDSDHPSLYSSSSNNNLQSYTDNELFSELSFDPLHFGSSSASNNIQTNPNNSNTFSQQAKSDQSLFCIDPFEILPAPAFSNDASSNTFPMASTNLINQININSDNQSRFYEQQQTSVGPTRPPPPIPIPSVGISRHWSVPSNMQQSLMLKDQNPRPSSNNNDTINDLVDLGDPGSPPPSPKFDPFS